MFFNNNIQIVCIHVFNIFIINFIEKCYVCPVLIPPILPTTYAVFNPTSVYLAACQQLRGSIYCKSHLLHTSNMLICLQLIVAEGAPNSWVCIKYIQSLFACCMIKTCVPAFVIKRRRKNDWRSLMLVGAD